MLLAGGGRNEVELYWGFEKSKLTFRRKETKILVGTFLIMV